MPGAAGAGEIGGEKSVARFILLDGDHIDENNRPKNAAFQREDILDGLSVDVTEPGAAAAAAAARHSAAMKKPYRYALAKVSDIRAIVDAEGRSVQFSVFSGQLTGI